VTILRIKEEDAVPRLTRMRLPRWAMLELGTQIAGERANVSPNDAPPVIGFETWRWGIRYCREHSELQELGWRICEEDQVSGITNDDLNLKLVFCTTDHNTGTVKSPKNVTEKGPASCRIISRNSGQILLFPEPNKKTPADLWYFCGYFCDSHVALEVSRPTGEIGGYFSSFSERIVIAQPGELPGIRRRIVPQEFADVPRPKVIRKD